MELREWAEFERVFGPLTVQERVDFAAANMSWATLEAANHLTKDDGERVTLADLLPDWAGERSSSESAEGQTAEQMIAVVRSFQQRKAKRGFNES